MPLETVLVVVAVIAAFGLFGLALFYVNLIAGARAITVEEELALRSR